MASRRVNLKLLKWGNNTMTQSKHTPAPWSILWQGGNNNQFVLARPSQQMGYDVDIRDMSEEEREANKKILSASPNMLNALLMVADISDHKLDGLTRGQIINLIKDIRDNEALPAIAKAKGL